MKKEKNSNFPKTFSLEIFGEFKKNRKNISRYMNLDVP